MRRPGRRTAAPVPACGHGSQLQAEIRLKTNHVPSGRWIARPSGGGPADANRENHWTGFSGNCALSRPPLGVLHRRTRHRPKRPRAAGAGNARFATVTTSAPRHRARLFPSPPCPPPRTGLCRVDVPACSSEPPFNCWALTALIPTRGFSVSRPASRCEPTRQAKVAAPGTTSASRRKVDS